MQYDITIDPIWTLITSDTLYNYTVCAHRLLKQKVFEMYFKNLGENHHVIDYVCKKSSCDASSMYTHSIY